LLFRGHAMPESRLHIAVVGCCVAWAPPCCRAADGEIVNRFCFLLACYCPPTIETILDLYEYCVMIFASNLLFVSVEGLRFSPSFFLCVVYNTCICYLCDNRMYCTDDDCKL
jgi:hypothetical protein